MSFDVAHCFRLPRAHAHAQIAQQSTTCAQGVREGNCSLIVWLGGRTPRVTLMHSREPNSDGSFMVGRRLKLLLVQGPLLAVALA